MTRCHYVWLLYAFMQLKLAFLHVVGNCNLFNGTAVILSSDYDCGWMFTSTQGSENKPHLLGFYFGCYGNTRGVSNNPQACGKLHEFSAHQ